MSTDEHPMSDVSHLPLDDAYAIEVYPDGSALLRWTTDGDHETWLATSDIKALMTTTDPRAERWRTAKVIRGIGAIPRNNPFAEWDLEAAGNATMSVLANWTWQLVAL